MAAGVGLVTYGTSGTSEIGFGQFDHLIFTPLQLEGGLFCFTLI